LLTLEDIKSFLSQLAENSDNVYWLGDPDFTYLAYVSPAYEKIWGVSRQCLYEDPRTWISHLHPDDKTRHPILEMKEKVAQLGAQARFMESYRIVRPDGKIRWIIDRGFPVTNQLGEIIAITGVALDVTKEKEAEENLRCAKEMAEKSSNIKSEFIANMSHDINTPLSGIIGMTELLVSELQEPKQLNFAKTILTAGKELMHFMNNCIAIAHSENCIPLFKEEIFNLKYLIDELVVLVKPAIIKKNLVLNIQYADSVPDYFIGSRTGIYRVLLNLLGNAIKFTAKGSVSIEVEYKKQPFSSTQAIVKFTVADTGIGIPKDKQQIIFERYTRLSPSYKGIYEGYGIGLYIVSQFVKAMEGELYLTSEEKQGSHFFVILPLKIPLLELEDYENITPKIISPTPLPCRIKNSSTDIKIPVIAEKSTEKTNTHVLLVEDHPIAQKIAEALLFNLGYKVDIADCGEKALELFSTKKYILIFMDIGLPDISGYTVIEKIRQAERENSAHVRVPIVVLTAHVVKDTLDYQYVGADALLNKPLSKEKVLDVMKNIL